MSIEVEYFCPLGSKCEEIKDGKIMRCRWYTKVVGKNPQSEEYIDQWDCSLAWLPILLLENAQRTMQTTATLQDFRNESTERQETFNKLVAIAAKSNLELLDKEKKYIEG